MGHAAGFDTRRRDAPILCSPLDVYVKSVRPAVKGPALKSVSYDFAACDHLNPASTHAVQPQLVLLVSLPMFSMLLLLLCHAPSHHLDTINATFRL